MTIPESENFAALGSLEVIAHDGRQVIDYWYHTPFFWRVERDGVLVLQVGTSDHVKNVSQMPFGVRLLTKPAMLAPSFGLRDGVGPLPEIHSATGREAERWTFPGTDEGTVLVDRETAIVLQFVGICDGFRMEGEHSRFEVRSTLDPR
jgi:hypothetical protein